MRVSMAWLKELLPTDKLDSIELKDLAYQLDMTGTAVEAINTTGAALEGVYIGQIVSKEHHPDSDKLWVTRVNVGPVGADVGAEDDGLLQIVCGAQNFEAGDKVPVATVGTSLGEDFVIKKAKLRGVVSCGMNCSERELGVGEGHEGLMILPADAPIGTLFSAWYGMSDTVLTLEITPNRPDCLSMVGVAREIGAVLEATPAPIPESSPVEDGAAATTYASVCIDDPELCNRYTARVIRNVKIGPSPQWLAERVTAAGARSINNVVDVTNFILFELGQPLHAFDLNRIEKGADGRAEVIIRRANAGEKITTLDGIERKLTPENLLITDPSGPITLAGVMGAESTEVSDVTTDIFLEAALFNPASISRTSRGMALISESSLRFERGVDPQGVRRALDRAATLIAEVAGGTVAPDVIDECPVPYQQLTLELRAERLNSVVGVEIPFATAADLLTRLGFTVHPQTAVTLAEEKQSFAVGVPSFRPDVEREIDLIEEVLRLWGMENVEATLPGGRKRIGGLTPHQRLRNTIGQTLRACGLNETMTYPFGDPADLQILGAYCNEDECLVELHNPMSSEQAALRYMLLPGLLHSVSLNKRHGVEDVHLYEMGKVFVTSEGRKQPKECEMVAGVLSGSWQRPAWNAPAVALDFFDAKGVVENIVRELSIDRYRLVEADYAWLQPGKGASIMLGGDVVGWIGEVHPSVASKFEIDDAVIAFELDVARFVKAAKPAREFAAPPRFPAIEIDIALVVDEATTAATVEQRINSLAKKMPLESAVLFDVYRGKGVEEGKKSLAYKLSYRVADRTLTSAEVEKAHEKLLTGLANQLNAHIRA